MTPELVFRNLLDKIHQIEKLSNKDKPYPSVDDVEKRLKAVFQKDYDAKKYDDLRHKMKLLYKNNTATKKEQDFSTNEALYKLISQVTKYFTMDRNTLRDNFKGEIKKPQLRLMNLLAIAYTDARDFEDYYACVTRLPEGIEGEWVSVVRSNDGESLLLANINIKREEDGSYEVLMKGRNELKGKGYEKNKCLQILFELDNKTLLLSFFVGGFKSPELLQGTFSGISSDGFPIAGIEWLVRPQLLPKDLQVPDVITADITDAKWQGMKAEIRYVFGNFDSCYFKIDKVSHPNWRGIKMK